MDEKRRTKVVDPGLMVVVDYLIEKFEMDGEFVKIYLFPKESEDDRAAPTERPGQVHIENPENPQG
jgi:hypothetical protein